MIITHLSAECFPVAKIGGLADVVGALPKYQNELEHTGQVVMPFYNNAFTKNHKFKSIYNDTLILGDTDYDYRILTLAEDQLSFPVFFVDVPELLYTDYVYSEDDMERFLAFQIAALDWIIDGDTLPDIIHCHDHHTGLIPFMTQESLRFKRLRKTPVVFTIHNAQYQGIFSHDHVGLIPEFNFKHVGLLDWNHLVNPLAAAIKCAWQVTTVSPSYLEELKISANSLEALLKIETNKCVGILNGIDTDVWNPETDGHIIANYNKASNYDGKQQNKTWLCNEFNLDPNKPLFAFIGRLVEEKGADLLPQIISEALINNDISILILGSGFKEIENQLTALKSDFKGNYNTFIGYDERLSHIIYAGADFILMPSRVEPCGLNQMYALRYGTIPIVNRIGGLKDTVKDLTEDGFGFCHDGATIPLVTKAITRATQFYGTDQFYNIRGEIMAINHSWYTSAQSYLNLYNSLIPVA